MLGKHAESACVSLLISLGDKDNHVASLHLAQMLYIWPFIAFFSWPLLLPQLLDTRTLRARMPRPAVVGTIVALMTVVVHFNTVVHPFTLADNRHYMFYVFRILLKHPAIKYAAVPVYFITAWLVMSALGSNRPTGGERASFAIVWLASTTLSLVTAPLVEPRYFMVPWLIWRLHVPELVPITGTARSRDGSDSKKKPVPRSQDGVTHIVRALIESHVLWIEVVWFLLINGVTCGLFLEKPFEWTQEPGKSQRFMW